MTIFKSRKAEDLNNDPEPIVRPSDGMRGDDHMMPNMLPGHRAPYGLMEKLIHAPRPEFTPTRDPEPWVEHEAERRLSQKEVDAGNERSQCWRGLEWSPRPEFDTPVNPILVAFRNREVLNGTRDDAAEWLETGDFERRIDRGNLAEHIDHARKVLTRLAALTKES